MPEPTNTSIKYTSMEDLKSVAQAHNILKKYKSTPESLPNLIETLYKKAIGSENDPETAYIFLTRCMETFTLLRKKPEFNTDVKYYKSMYGTKITDTMKRLEVLTSELENIYEERRKMEEESKNLKQPETVNDKKPQVAPEQNGSYLTPSNGVITNNSRTQNLPREEKISMTCKELFEVATKCVNNALLVIDVRLKEDFLLSSMKIHVVDVINVPEDLIGPTLIPSKLETLLEKPFQLCFKRRADYDQVVILDWFTTKDNLESVKNRPIFLMISKLKKYESKVKYKNKPIILEGGYDEWLARYPHFTTNSSVSPPKRDDQSRKISIDNINYPTTVLLEPEVEKVTPKPVVPPQETVTKPSIDRSTKPVHPDKKTDDSIKENGVVTNNTERKNSSESNESVEEPAKTTNEENISKVKRESFEEDDEELKKQCIRSGRRSALTTLPSPPLPIDNNTSDSEEDLDETYRNEQENRMNALKNASSSILNETSSSLKRYSSTPNISKIENEYSKPPIDRSTKPSNDDQINIYTMTPEGGGLTGLMNIGNTCYMNSILQCLSNTEPFRKDMYHLSKEYSNPDSKTEGRVAREVSNIIKKLWNGDNGPVSCKELKILVGRLRDTFRGSEQQDSHEFLTILIDWMHEDLNEPIERSLKGADEKSGEKAWGEFISKNNSKIRVLFYGQQKSTVSCNTCEKESVTFEPFSNLSLPLPSAEKCTLAECLKLYTSNEHITGWQCPRCKCPRAATKKLDITKLPPVLVIHFKRFTSDGWCRKRLTNVDFPDLLDMTPYIIGREHRNFRYELYAISNHMGTMETGHYTAYCRNSVNRRWYKFDDDSVSCINNAMKSSSAYIVFYKCYN